MRYKVYGESLIDIYYFYRWFEPSIELTKEQIMSPDFIWDSGLRKKTEIQKHLFIKDIDINRAISIDDNIMVDEKVCKITDILYNCDEDCFNIFTDYTMEHILVDEDVENRVAEKEKEYYDNKNIEEYEEPSKLNFIRRLFIKILK